MGCLLLSLVLGLTLQARGHEPRELVLDPQAVNGGVPRVLVLRRE